MAAAPAEVLGLPGEEVSEAPRRPPRPPLPAPRSRAVASPWAAFPAGRVVPADPLRCGAGGGAG